MDIDIQAIGPVDIYVVRGVVAALSSIFGSQPKINDSVALDTAAFNIERNQFLADSLLEFLKPRNVGFKRLLGITDVDLYTENRGFVFGLADPRVKTAIISLYQLRQGHYGLPENPDLLIERAVKEAVHELGHTFGLGHCQLDGTCVMSFSGSLMDIDVKRSSFCPGCQPRLTM
jgi:archaemetzincin